MGFWLNRLASHGKIGVPSLVPSATNIAQTSGEKYTQVTPNKYMQMNVHISIRMHVIISRF